MFIEHELLPEELPEECIRDCSGQGDVTDAVEFWVRKLDFKVPREKAIAFLGDYGAWDHEELNAWSDEEISLRILWLACCDFKEGNDSFYLG